MDNKKKDPPSNESSLLLKYPIDLCSPYSNNESILMPVGVPESSRNLNRSTENVNKEEAQLISEPSAICQLEQPLLFRRMSSPDVVSDVASTSIHGAEADRDQLKTKPLGPTFFESNVEIPSPPRAYPELAALYSTPKPENTKALYKSTSFAMKPDTTYSTDFFHQASSSETEPCSSSANTSFLQSDCTSQQSIASNSCDTVKPYWMFQNNIESKEIWYGFSEWDSERLENAHQLGQESIVSTDGGRYDVFMRARLKKSVYFYSKELPVRRCTWFYQDESNARFKPYDEEIGSVLESTYQNWKSSNEQDTRFVVANSDGTFLFEKPSVMVQYDFEGSAWAGTSEPKRYRTVKRGLPDGFQIMPNESPQIDNLLFIVQGIGSFCDLRFRTVSECVDGFREISNKLIESHFKKNVDQGHIGRVEILPVAWHAKFRTSDSGLDRTMKRITLPSISKLRHFTNDTLIDILLYSSPSYCQSILDTVADELNALYEAFISRNPGFSGKVFVAGHSLGSLILFDILSNQNTDENNAEKEVSLSEEKKAAEEFSDISELLKSLDLDEYLDAFKAEKIELSTLPNLSDEDFKSLGLPIGPRRILMNAVQSKEKVQSTKANLSESHKFASSENIYTKLVEDSTTPRNLVFPFQKPNIGIKPFVYPKLHFHPAGFFAMGSPISMFLAVRGFDAISDKYSFPTCPAFFHIFHPYDPVAFRIEPMIDRNFNEKPALIPHHKGRKRMHLEIKENVTKIARDLRQTVVDTISKTWSSVSNIAGLQPAVMETVNSIVSEEMPKITTFDDNLTVDFAIGNLNGGRRIDYVLQEKPLEALNDYVWALTSHATYWDSEDTVLMILREIYSTQGITATPPNENLVPEDPLDPCAKEHSPFTNEYFEKTLYSSLPTDENAPINMNVPLTSTVKKSLSTPLSAGAPVFIPGSQLHSDPLPTVKRSASANMPSSSGTSLCIPESDYYSAPLKSTVDTSTMPSSSEDSVSIPSRCHSTPLTSTVENPNSSTTIPSSSGEPTIIPGQHQSVPLTSAVKISTCAPMPSTSRASISVPGSKHIGPPPLSGFVKRSPFAK